MGLLYQYIYKLGDEERNRLNVPCSENVPIVEQATYNFRKHFKLLEVSQKTNTLYIIYL